MASYSDVKTAKSANIKKVLCRQRRLRLYIYEQLQNNCKCKWSKYNNNESKEERKMNKWKKKKKSSEYLVDKLIFCEALTHTHT